MRTQRRESTKRVGGNTKKRKEVSGNPIKKVKKGEKYKWKKKKEKVQKKETE